MADRPPPAPTDAAEAALRASEARFRALVEHGSDLIAILDTTGCFRYVSPSHQRVLGWAPAELLGRDGLGLVHEDDVEYLRWTFDEALRAAGPVRPRYVRLRRRDGGWCVADMIITNLVDDSAVGGVVVNARDVTEQETLAEQLRQAQKMEALGQLAGGLAHDFNNVLAAIAGFAQLVRGDLPDGDRRRADLDEIVAATVRGSTVTRQLLTFSRKRTVETQVIDLAEVVRDTGRMLRPLLPSSIAVELRTGTAPAWISADRGQLEQVVTNLAVNARDAMPDGGTLTVAVETRAAPRPCGLLVVRDTGAGMSAEVRSRIFEPFFTTKPAGQGSGLGLATVYGIVRQFGGTVGVESEEGAGTTFTVTLPLAPPPAARRSERAAGVVAPRGATILLAEDEEAVRRSVQRLLERAGHTVLVAADGAAALQLLVERAGRVDLVLTDATMPVLGGRELAARVAARYPTVPVVLMSGYSERLAAASGGAQPLATLQKPFTADELRDAVAEALRG
jgi:PAS domain S-box-containing protein